MSRFQSKNSRNRQKLAKSYCLCFDDGKPKTLDNLGGCECGEYPDCNEWFWEPPTSLESSWVMVHNARHVTFHPFYSSGTAVVRGNVALEHNYHYYWEIKMLTEPYGTDIMVGLGTRKVDTVRSRYRFTSLLGQDDESYGLSYTGAVRHSDQVYRDGPGFCKGTIVGVKVDFWQGTVEFFLNRKSRGVAFFNLRRHPTATLIPMVSSTAAQSSIRLVYSSSWQASLLVDAAKILGASTCGEPFLPPGLKNKLKSQFWMTLPGEGCALYADEREARADNSTLEDKIDASDVVHSYACVQCKDEILGPCVTWALEF
ncbi:SPRY domain-containing SOCS box protein 3-like isoform X2 [Anticarsia gemmatalis]|uniref:SPRY domain-containing SOCS box protein 3-like isoform X2 n=1 Tax=Anticarsia gemmatalis TaxID=129554 RepID=UPI003F75E445